MPAPLNALNLIVTGDDCGEGDLSRSYGRHLFNWGSDSGKDGHARGGGGYSEASPSLSSSSLWRRPIIPVLKDGAICSAGVAASATKVEFWRRRVGCILRVR